MKDWKDTLDDALGALGIFAVGGLIYVATRVFPVFREFVLAIFPWIVPIGAVWIGVLYFRSKILPQWQERAEGKRREKAERDAAAQEQLIHSVATERQRIEQVKRDIRAMPRYEVWRQAVFARFGRRCMVCPSTNDIEVDHYPLSLHSIVVRNGIRDTIQAYECVALWDVDNGKPLCRICHDRTSSSRVRAALTPVRGILNI